MKHLDVRRFTRLLVPIAVAALSMTLTVTGTAQGSQRFDNNNTQYQQRDRSANANANRNSLPTGTVIPVKLDDALSSKSASVGDKFTATIIRGSDDAGLPQGTRLEGIVREATPSDGGHPGSLDFDFRRIVFPDGSAQAITASLYSLSGKAVKRGDGRLIATADKGKDRLKFIGLGAGAGLLLGTVTKQNSIFSTLLGAGAGYLYNEVGNKPKPGDVNLKKGQEFGVRLDRELAFNAATRRYYRQSRESPRMPGVDRDNTSGYRDHVRVMVNEERVRFNANNRPYIRDGAVFVPLAAMANAANFDYRYDAAMRTIYARNDEVHVALGSKSASVNGRRRSLPTAAEQRNGVTFVPLQFIAWAAQGAVGYDEASGMVSVSNNERK